MSTTIDISLPSDAPAPEPTIDDIVKQHLASAEASGTTVVGDDAVPATQGASEADGAHTADPAGATPAPATEGGEAPAEGGEKPADDITARRVRAMLAKLDEREAAIAAREAAGTRSEADIEADVIARLLKSPKALLAKHGKTIDDTIDASIAEGKVDPAAAGVDRLTALERRIEEREAREAEQANQAAIDNRKAEIAGLVKASGKFPLIAEADRANAVTDFMIEYHSIHGKPIAWQAAAGIIESDLKATAEKVAKKLGWAAPAAKPAAAAAPADRPGTTSIGGASRTAAPTNEDLPEDPTLLMAELVRRAERGLLKTA